MYKSAERGGGLYFFRSDISCISKTRLEHTNTFEPAVKYETDEEFRPWTGCSALEEVWPRCWRVRNDARSAPARCPARTEVSVPFRPCLGRSWSRQKGYNYNFLLKIIYIFFCWTIPLIVYMCVWFLSNSPYTCLRTCSGMLGSWWSPSPEDELSREHHKSNHICASSLPEALLEGRFQFSPFKIPLRVSL